MGVIVAVVNQKGGCGRTTTCVHLAAACARRGWRALVVDLDPQAHVALALGVARHPNRPTVSDVLAHAALTGVGDGLDQAIHAARPGIDLIPACPELTAFEMRLCTVPGHQERVAEHVAEVADGWDVVLIDTPAGLGLLTRNAIVAAHQVLVPYQPSPFGAAALREVRATVDGIAAALARRIDFRVLPTMTGPGDRDSTDWVQRVAEAQPNTLLPVAVRRSDLFPRAAEIGVTAFELSPGSSSALEYAQAADALIQRWSSMRPARPAFVGLRVVEDGVEFSNPECAPEDLRLAGQFNDWTPDAGVELETHGVRGWVKRLRLDPGRYEYKFVVRDQWVPDPVNPRHSRSGIGVVNSVIELPPPVRIPRPAAARPRRLQQRNEARPEF